LLALDSAPRVFCRCRPVVGQDARQSSTPTPPPDCPSAARGPCSLTEREALSDMADRLRRPVRRENPSCRCGSSPAAAPAPTMSVARRTRSHPRQRVAEPTTRPARLPARRPTFVAQNARRRTTRDRLDHGQRRTGTRQPPSRCHPIPLLCASPWLFVIGRSGVLLSARGDAGRPRGSRSTVGR